MDYPRDVIQLL